MSRYLFAYGTLQFPQVLRALTARSLPGEPATLDGYARFLVRGAHYPGIVPRADTRTGGVLWRGVTDADLKVLDRFEGDLYERVVVDAVTRDGPRRAWCYVVAPRQRQRLTGEPWTNEHFAANHLAGYLRRLSRM